MPIHEGIISIRDCSDCVGGDARFVDVGKNGSFDCMVIVQERRRDWKVWRL